MNIWITILLIVIYILIVAVIMGVMCKYENAGHEIGLIPLLAMFWPTLLIAGILYYPCKWSFKFGEKLINFNKDIEEIN